jgi:hypothetical protein
MSGKLVLGVLWVGVLTSAAWGQGWAEKMFQERSHEFGSVARYSKSEHAFVFTNPYVEDVHVTDAQPSCGCTSVEIRNATVKTRQQGAIVAKFNTKAFFGQHGATITVSFDRPFPATVQLHVSGVVRDDVAVNPGVVSFGSLDAGAAAERWLAVAGRPGWKITNVRSTNPHVQAELAGTRPGNGSTTYDIRVRTDGDLPEGLLHERLLLSTNDPGTSQLAVPVEGQVVATVSVSPGSLYVGDVLPGQQLTRQVVVRGKTPFRIVSVSGEGKYFRVNLAADPDPTPKLVHIVPLNITVLAQPGKAEEKIRIVTDLNNTAAQFNTIAMVQATSAEGPMSVGARPSGSVR